MRGTGDLDSNVERDLLVEAQAGDRDAFAALVAPWRRSLYGYVYRMVTHRQDAEDLVQEALVRALERIGSFRGESRFKSWLFGIATHVAVDHLRRKGRWRIETQLEAEVDCRNDAGRMTEVRALLAAPGTSFEIREHIAFCFSCVARTLEPEEQAALVLREVLGFSAGEAAAILGSSEPRFRHRLAAARSAMVASFDGMCQLVNKTGACWQCRGLRELAPERNRGEDLVAIELSPGVALTPESLFDARLEIVREADLEGGHSHALHEDFFDAVTRQEEAVDR